MSSNQNGSRTNGDSTMENGGSDGAQPDLIMMTPLKKELDHTVLRVERVSPINKNGSDSSNSSDRHVAGGQHQGIIVNKQLAGSQALIDRGTFDLRLSFKVFLVNAITQIHQQECRELRFWFSPDDDSFYYNEDNDDDYGDGNESPNGGRHTNGNGNGVDHRRYAIRMQTAQAFFRALVNPGDFPRNYVGFIMKLMKTLQQPIYRPLVQIELEVRSIDEPFERPPSSLSTTIGAGSRPLSIDDITLSQMVQLSEDKVLEMIESAYPNPLSLVDIAATTRSSEEDVHHLVMDLVSKGVARFTDSAGGQVVRVTSDETQVKRVRQMPDVVRSQQPTIAIITAQFCEKLAVDAMIDNKDTYVRYKVEGESNVYTLGNIGRHRVVATKLPAVGNSRSAMIAAGNTTTRLLGTFQHVEYVFLVGIGGGVPHYTDYRQHVRLGDVVVSTSPRNLTPPQTSPTNASTNGGTNGSSYRTPTRSDYVYVHCEKLRSSPDEPLNSSNPTWKKLQTVDSFNYRFWCPFSFELQDIAKKLCQEGAISGERPWEHYLDEAREKLHESDDLDFVRPDPSTDKLYMSIGTNDLIEMAHPEEDSNDTDPTNHQSHQEYDPRANGMPKIHFGAIGSGRMAIGNEQLRQDIALKYGIKAFDIEFDTVIESIFGNRKDRYIVIRGVADYKDGARKKEWQPYAALSAAAFMKAILCKLNPMPANAH